MDKVGSRDHKILNIQPFTLHGLRKFHSTSSKDDVLWGRTVANVRRFSEIQEHAREEEELALRQCSVYISQLFRQFLKEQSNSEVAFCCHVRGATNRCPGNVLRGYKICSCWCNVKTKMSFCKFSYRERKRTFAIVCGSSLFFLRRPHHCNLANFESLSKWRNQAPWRKVHGSCFDCPRSH